MNWKLIILGGLAYYVTAFVVSMASAPLIHEGVLDPHYMATTEFWRPELVQDPPDMGSLMPYWITTGLLGALVFAGIYGKIRVAFSGAPWKKGLQFGVVLFLISACLSAAWSGVFNLPEQIWFWWAFDSLIYYLAGSTVLGIVAQKVAPE